MTSPPDFSRRAFLFGGAAVFGMAAVPSLFRRAVFGQGIPLSSNSNARVLVVVFQRGAADGLSLVVPYTDPEYYRLRPHLAIARPGSAPDAALDLDGRFGLHPRLAPLEPLYRRNELAFIHAAGSPDATRSHFDAQYIMESGSTDATATRDGLLNRCLSRIPGPPNAFRAMAMGTLVPDALSGPASALVVDDLRNVGIRAGRPEVRDRLSDSFRALYQGHDAVSQAGRDALDAAARLQRLDAVNYRAEHDANYPRSGFGRHLMQLAQLIKADLGLRIAFVDVGGWDTHVAQGNAGNGALAGALTDFGASLASFAQDLGTRMANVAVVTMTEFGRTVAENGTLGTDHGHGSAMMVLGAGVRGGRVLGTWPGLASDARFEGRDLAVTTDFRDVMSELIEQQLSLTDSTALFPGYAVEPGRRLGLFAAHV